MSSVAHGGVHARLFNMSNDEVSPLVRQLGQRLDRQYYERSPTAHFRARATMICAFADGVAAKSAPGTFTRDVLVRLPEWSSDETSDDSEAVEAAQLAVTVEAFMLAHHAAESLLQQLFAHLDARPQAPIWFVLSVWDAKFKDRVARLRDDVSDSALRDIVDWAFLGDGEQLTVTAGHDAVEARIAHAISWVRQAADFHLHTGGGYNAAKHGLSAIPALRHISFVRSEQGEPVGSPIELFHGAALLSLESQGKPKQRQWFQVARLVDAAGLVAMTLVLSDLMESLWQVGRARQLHEPAVVSLMATPSFGDLIAGRAEQWGEVRLPFMAPPKMSDEATTALLAHLAKYSSHPDDEVSEEPKPDGSL